jgi:hypothetical protein
MAFIVETVSGKKNGKTTSDPKSNGIKRPVFKPFFKVERKFSINFIYHALRNFFLELPNIWKIGIGLQILPYFSNNLSSTGNLIYVRNNIFKMNTKYSS